MFLTEYRFHQINEVFCMEKGPQVCYNLDS
jgi:hypothetical protein